MIKLLRKIFGIKEPKKFLKCPKTGNYEVDPDSGTHCVECSKKAYGAKN